ncbi:MAG TPA: hypothetical protein VGQ81_15295 [Acidobacteriota bacterium]|jgi:hypothetical protein|nr:hypothetical protein [Acidobacteriota bacterium]
MKRMIGLLCCGLILGSIATATSIRKLNFRQLVDESELVIYGRVLYTHSYLMPSRGWVLTDTRIEVLSPIKGRVSSVVTVTELGGVVGDIGMAVPGTARFERGEEAVVFLKNVGGKWRTAGLIQGKFAVVDEGGEKIAIPAVSMDDGRNRIPLTELLSRISQMERIRRGQVR